MERCGKLIVALDPSELGGSTASRSAAAPTASRACAVCSGPEIAEVEPHATGIAALHSPHTGIVDFPAVARALAARAAGAAAASCVLGHEVTGVRRAGREASSSTGPRRAVTARHAVFCAGAWADRLAVAAGAPPTRASSPSAASTCA